MGRGFRLPLSVLLVTLVASMGPSLGETVWVSPDGDDAIGTGSEPSPFHTLGRAIAAAEDGDTVRVLPGTYFECVDASSRAISLLADAIEDTIPNNRSTVLDGTGTCGGSTCEDRPGLACYGDGGECLGACDNRVCSVTVSTRCDEDADCPSGESCTGTSSTGVCSNDRSAECVIDVCTIPTGESVGACRDHPEIACASSADCTDLGCDFGACVKLLGFCGGPEGPWCTSDEDCAEGTTCDELVASPVISLGPGSSITGFTVRGGGASGVLLLGSGALARNRVEHNRSAYGGGGIALLAGAEPAPVRCLGDTDLSCVEDADCDVCADDPSVPCRDLQDCHDAGLEGPCSLRGPCLEVTRAIVEENTVLSNVAEGGDSGGGGMFARVETATGTATLLVSRGNLVSGNSAAGSGGGVEISATGDGVLALEIEDNDVSANTGLAGGGVRVRASDGGASGSTFVRVAGNTFRDNDAEGPGGGLSLDVSAGGAVRTVLSGNQFRSNAAGTDGGGASLLAAGAGGARMEVSANSLSANTAEGSGGALDLRLDVGPSPGGEPASLEVAGNELVGNGARVGGGGVRAIVASAPDAPAVSASVSGNEIRANVAASHGGGVELRAVSSAEAGVSTHLERNLLSDNAAEDEEIGGATGGGLFLYVGGTAGVASADVDFSTIASNRCDVGAAGIEIEADTSGTASARVAVRNSVLASNLGTAIGGPFALDPGKVMAGTGRTLEVRVAWNDVYAAEWEEFERTLEGETIFEGANVLEDPLLLGDFALDVCSPAIDIADPAADFSGEPQPSGARANSGHLGGTAVATPTLPDVTGDRMVDGMDLLRLSVAFAADRVLSPSRYDAAYDLDHDGLVDGNDIAYVGAFFGFHCP